MGEYESMREKELLYVAGSLDGMCAAETELGSSVRHQPPTRSFEGNPRQTSPASHFSPP